ncbi:MAG: mannose-1-phosphate guanylyltransferase [Chloroflexi bacterium]|nr:mannose-1-phosphate guanylyltransferase [Chloroflexota bacterium]
MSQAAGVLPELFVTILAGGSGTRLWPLSRKDRPKQFLSLLSERSLIQETVDRVRPLVAPERTLVVTERSQASALRAQLPELPPENVLVEPVQRGTAGAIALAAFHIHRQQPHAVMASLHSDHLIPDAEGFRRTLLAAARVAQQGERLMTIGVEPTFPSTQLGYIQRADQIGVQDDFPVYAVQRFVEKPHLEQAQAYLASGQYVWNSGLFIWRVDTILACFERLLPDIYRPLSRADPSTLEAIYPTLPQATIDVGIMERASSVGMVPARFAWSDIGSWAELWDALPKAGGDNVVRGQHLGVDTQRSLVHATSRLVATVGVEDLVIVETPDVVLVCPRHRAQEVRKLVELLQARGLGQHL